MSLELVVSMFASNGNFCDHVVVMVDRSGDPKDIPNHLSPFFPGCSLSISSHSLNVRLREMYPESLTTEEVQGLVKEMIKNCPYTQLVSKSKFELYSMEFDNQIAIGSVEDGSDVRLFLSVSATPIYQIVLRDGMNQTDMKNEMSRMITLHNALGSLIHHCDDVLQSLPDTGAMAPRPPVDPNLTIDTVMREQGIDPQPQPEPIHAPTAPGTGSMARNAGLPATEAGYADENLPERPNAPRSPATDRFLQQNPLDSRLKEINRETLTRVEGAIKNVAASAARQVAQPAPADLPVEYKSGFLSLLNESGSRLNIIFEGQVAMLAETGALDAFVKGMNAVAVNGDSTVQVESYTGWMGRLSGILEKFKLQEVVRARPSRTVPTPSDDNYPLVEFIHL